MQHLSPGRLILTSVATFTTVGGFLMDWNRTHLFNAHWPPHAKFHDAWTILLCSLLGTSGLYSLWSKQTDPERQLALGAFLPALAWIAMGGSFLFPGAAGLESEFPELVPEVAGVPLNEGVASTVMLTLSGIGYALERSHLQSAVTSK